MTGGHRKAHRIKIENMKGFIIMSTKLLVNIPVFRAGDYGEKGKYSANDVAAMALSYDPAFLEAPVTPDHAQEGPAWGWVTSLKANGDLLHADMELLPDAYAAMQEGRYRYRSVEIYQKLQTSRGELPYIKAVSILGAATPAVKGLGAIQFSIRHEPFTLIRFDESGAQAMAQFRAEVANLANRFVDAGKFDNYRDAIVHAERELQARAPVLNAPSPQVATSVILARTADALQAMHPEMSYRECLATAQRSLQGRR